MHLTPTYTKYPSSATYSEIIDVRSENEFTQDHIPGAINLPVLNNEERAKVGTIYKQVSPFAARKVGAAIISQNISQHLHSHFATKEKQYSPLIYCWRGGQRSSSLALILTQIGWQVTLLEGGYKTYRAYVRQQLAQLPSQFTYKVLCGLTGTGKTHILRQLGSRGVQVLDLEELGNHRGSLLGQEWDSKPSPQPSQKRFESLLLQELQKLDPHKIVWVESESNKIGQVYLPLILWKKMKQATCVELQLPNQERIKWLLQQYPHLIKYPEILKNKLGGLKYRYGSKKIEEWYNWIDRKEWEALVGDLLKYHYDPAYYRSLGQTYQQVKLKLPLADLSPKSIETIALSSLSSLSLRTLRLCGLSNPE